VLDTAAAHANDSYPFGVHIFQPDGKPSLHHSVLIDATGLSDELRPAVAFTLKHDPEKWKPVFRKKTCFTKKIERPIDSI
jgi:hypothetical protein